VCAAPFFSEILPFGKVAEGLEKSFFTAFKRAGKAFGNRGDRTGKGVWKVEIRNEIIFIYKNTCFFQKMGVEYI